MDGEIGEGSGVVFAGRGETFVRFYNHGYYTIYCTFVPVNIPVKIGMYYLHEKIMQSGMIS